MKILRSDMCAIFYSHVEGTSKITLRMRRGNIKSLELRCANRPCLSVVRKLCVPYLTDVQGISLCSFLLQIMFAFLTC